MFTICLQFGHTLFITDPYNVLKDKERGYIRLSVSMGNLYVVCD